jgi:hypothetical protein
MSCCAASDLFGREALLFNMSRGTASLSAQPPEHVVVSLRIGHAE